MPYPSLDSVVNIRLTTDEKRRLRNAAEEAGLTLSAYGRRRLLGHVIVTHSDRKAIGVLRRTGGLLKLVHRESDGAYSEETAAALRDVREAIERVAAGT